MALSPVVVTVAVSTVVFAPAIIGVGAAAFVARPPNRFQGTTRRDWAELLVVCVLSGLALSSMWLFFYYHWSNDLTFLNQFRPDIDNLKLLNVITALLAVGITVKLFRKVRLIAVLSVVAPLPAALTLPLYG